MTEPIDHKTIEKIATRYLPSDSTVQIAPILTGKFNTSFFVTAGEISWVVRIAPPRDAVFIFYERDMMRQEPGIHRLLSTKTSVPVAPVIAFDDSGDLVDRDFIIMERLAGNPISDVACDYGKVLHQVGKYLAQVHGQTASMYGYIGEHQPMPAQRRWVDAFHIMWNRLIDGIVEVGHYDEKESNTCRRLLDRNIRLFDRNLPAALLHMDVWAQNILVDEHSNVTGIVDWDRALWGDPEIEYAVLDYCGISEPAFWEGYGRQRDTSPEAQVRQVFYLLYELQKYIIIRQGRGNDPTRARQYKQQVMQIFERLT